MLDVGRGREFATYWGCRERACCTTVPRPTPRVMLAAVVIIGGLTLSRVLLVGLLFVCLFIAVQIGGEILYVLKGLLPHG